MSLQIPTGMDRFPKPGETWCWWGKDRVVSKSFLPTGWVYFTDGSRAKANKRMRYVSQEELDYANGKAA